MTTYPQTFTKAEAYVRSLQNQRVAEREISTNIQYTDNHLGPIRHRASSVRIPNMDPIQDL